MPGCTNTAVNDSRCQPCYRYLRRHKYDTPLDVMEKRRERDARRINQPVLISKKQGEILARLVRDRRLGGTIDPTDYGAEIMGQVAEAAGNVAFYRERILAYQQEGGEIYVEMFHQTGLPTGEAKPHVLVAMYDRERDRLVAYSTAAAKLGIEERRVRLQEADARDFAKGVGEATVAAGLTDEQAEVFRQALADSLRRGDAARINAGLDSGSARPAV